MVSVAVRGYTLPEHTPYSGSRGTWRRCYYANYFIKHLSRPLYFLTKYLRLSAVVVFLTVWLEPRADVEDGPTDCTSQRPGFPRAPHRGHRELGGPVTCLSDSLGFRAEQ